jgi:hypothetical protein
MPGQQSNFAFQDEADSDRSQFLKVEWTGGTGSCV